MTPIQIAYFKHFLYDKGIQRIYIHLYRSRRIKGGPEGDSSGNPESLEQFLSSQPYFRVIMNAFYFIAGSQYGYDYWKEINKQWIKYWDMNENNFSNEKYSLLAGTFGILRQNWDLKDYWKVETKEQTYKRMGIEPPPGFDSYNESLPSNPEKEVTEDTSSSFVENKDLLEGFTAVDSSEYCNPGRKIKNNMVTINRRNNGYRITFSIDISKNLISKNYKFVELLTNNATHKVALVFNNILGCGLTTKNRNSNVVINSRNIVDHIHQFYELGKGVDYYFLEIISTEEKEDKTIFILKLLE